jgi:hypothetical protein
MTSVGCCGSLDMDVGVRSKPWNTSNLRRLCGNGGGVRQHATTQITASMNSHCTAG